MHLYDDPAYVTRITSGLAAHADSKRGSTYDVLYGPEKAAAYRQKLRDASPGRLAKFKRRETRPERIVREMLTGLGLAFQAQAPLGFYTVDFLVGDLVIQADGDYWHGNPAIFAVLSAIQVKRRRLDASCDGYLQERGYRVLRLWECDLNRCPAECLRKIQEETSHGR
jgi:very-short-patch-repair endonuclease